MPSWRRRARSYALGIMEYMDSEKAQSIGELTTVVMDALAEAVTIRGPEDRLVYANRAALDRLGFASVEDLRNADPRALMGPYEIAGEDGREIRMEDLPSVRLLRGEHPE